MRTNRRGTAPSAWYLRIKGAKPREFLQLRYLVPEETSSRVFYLPANRKIRILIQLVQLFVEMRQSSFQGFFVVGMGRCFEIVQYVFARELDVRTFTVLL